MIALLMFGINQIGVLDPMYLGIVFGFFGAFLIADIFWHRFYSRPLIPRFFLSSKAVRSSGSVVLLSGSIVALAAGNLSPDALVV